jgi:CRISPR/Cas system Type II protein with McrA/HNH and RuvC-like nuclease domain
LSVDHIIPRSIAPELDNVIANLELMPLRMNQSKGDTIGQRQKDLAKKLYAAGLLSKPTLD